jgi:uncharacterized protein YecT (DUF1311 family)
MKTRYFAPLVLAISLPTAFGEPSPIVPKGWLKPEQLEQVEETLQKQLDTGVGMTATAWNMATVKDAELFVIYVAVCEKLSEAERGALRNEQEAWMKRREKAAAEADDGKSGTMGRQFSAGEYMAWTDKRIVDLKKRLEKH